MDLSKYAEFPVTVFGELERVTDVLSKGRVRIFYKGFNRNSTYITDEFAQKLISTLPYSPVKGIYDTESQDFTTHGTARTEGRAYGVVGNPTNFAWEKHLDEDGMEREYACADVYLWTGLYEEAKQIPGKGQSMELYEPSIQGIIKMREGRKCFEYTDACFLGLQALGDEVTPCFEGSAFYSLYTSIKEMVDKIEQHTLNSKTDSNTGGKSEMPSVNFKLSDGQKHDAIFALLNPNFNEAGNWEVSYAICDIYDKYALCYNYEMGQYERVEYSKDDATDSVTLGQKTKCFILDITEAEKTALEALRTLNGDTFEQVDIKFSEYSALPEQISAKDTKIGELETANATLTTERDNFSAQLNTANETISAQNTELEGLKNYKLAIETNEKKAILDKYAEVIDNAIISNYTNEKLANYTADELEKDLAFELIKATPSLFTKDPQIGMLPKDQPLTGLEAILSKYEQR